MPRRSPPQPPREEPPAERLDAPLRIIGGTWRGRHIEYSGEERTRPMKERLREAIFNLLDTNLAGKVALDLFAGTGALGFEALSRGATQAVFFEQHFPTTTLIKRTAAMLQDSTPCDLPLRAPRPARSGERDRCLIVPGNTFLSARRLPQFMPGAWLVFCSPPYDFYIEREAEMLALLDRLLAAAPPGSVMIVECDARFDLARLPSAELWEVRHYPPAVVALRRL